MFALLSFSRLFPSLSVCSIVRLSCRSSVHSFGPLAPRRPSEIVASSAACMPDDTRKGARLSQAIHLNDNLQRNNGCSAKIREHLCKDDNAEAGRRATGGQTIFACRSAAADACDCVESAGKRKRRMLNIVGANTASAATAVAAVRQHKL